jgi:succinyl-CoA synthetase beta subunit
MCTLPLIPHNSTDTLFLFTRLIKDSGLKIIAFDDLDEAAQRAVQLATA